MYINPFPFGIFIGVIGTVVVEVVALVIIAMIKRGEQ